LLDEYAEMETIAYRMDHPHTAEVWPSVATGMHPSEHGITGQGEWDSTALTQLAKLADRLKITGTIRGKVGDAIKQNTDQTWKLQLIEHPTFLDGENRAVHNWPGVHRNEPLEYVWGLYQQLKDGELSATSFRREAYTEAAGKFGYLREALNHDVELAATHVHLLDVLGHMYPSDEDSYEAVYRDVDAMVADLRSALGPEDDLLLLSDHGIQTAWVPNDTDPGTHSWRALASSTVGKPPEHVLNVREWVESEVETLEVTSSEMELPEEQLRELGYL
jgi:predicted AlkP superfamily pyrophosphatase or phosphodiesterase